MIKNLFGLLKPSDNFYLELDENKAEVSNNGSAVTSPSVPTAKATRKATATPTAKATRKATATSTWVAPTTKEKTLPEKYLSSFADNSPVMLTADSAAAALENADLVIRAAYKQVFGNAHLMESERLPQIESQLRSGQLTVIEFVRQLAKSERYRALFWDNCSNVRAIELNFKHLLGRAPQNYAEISQHIQILAEGGFEAEIDSYLDSEEYIQNFGDFQVPYFRGYSTQTATNVVGFTHSFPLVRVACSSEKSTVEGTSSRLQTNLIQNSPSNIPDIRSIPDSYPSSFVAAPKNKKSYRRADGLVGYEWIKMAKELNLPLPITPAVIPPKIQYSYPIPQDKSNESVPAETANTNQDKESSLTPANNVIPKNTFRRRPGKNLNKFIEMACNTPYYLRQDKK